MVNHVAMIVPLVLYFVLIMGIAWLGNRFAAKRADTAGFMEEYFIGSRSMGGFVLAMAVITTYTSASSFVGGPGIAYNLGLGFYTRALRQRRGRYTFVGGSARLLHGVDARAVHRRRAAL